jgi:Tfp pilus assembly protein FimV
VRFEGRVYFDFVNPAVWWLYRFLGIAAKEGADLRLDWRPFDAEGDVASKGALASFAAVQAEHPERQGTYLQALLALRHHQGADLGSSETLAAAADAARVAAPSVSSVEWHDLVAASTLEARELGVVATPTMYRHGPVLHVEVNQAALSGDVQRRLKLIDGVLGDDGIWRLSKP